MGRLENQSILITGGASGLGLAIVKRFVDEGALITILDRSETALASVKESVAGVQTIAGDVRSLEDNEAAVEAAVSAYGKLDCAIGNAGIWDFQNSLVDMNTETMDAAFDELFHVNVKGYLHLAKAALKPLTQSRGSIIYTVSNAGFYPNGGGPLYTMTKHAVVGLIRQLAFELGPYIRVNGVAPGAINTNLSGPTSMGLDEMVIPGDAIEQFVVDNTPTAIMPSPEDYAGAYVFFASRQDNIPATGAILNHDGGIGVRGIGTARGGDNLAETLG